MMKTLARLAGQLLAVLAIGGAWWLPAASAAAPAARLLQPAPLQARVQTAEYTLTPTGVEVPGAIWNTTPGAPQLPLQGLTFALPANANWELTYQSPGSRILAEQVTIAAAPTPNLDLNGPVAPQDLATLPSAVPLIDRPDPGIYGVNAFYPASPVLAGEPVWQDGQRILPVRVFPFQYNPVTRQLRYHPDLQITVLLSGGGAATPAAPETGGFYQPTDLPGEGVLRVHTQQQGLYRLTYGDLAAAGISVGPGGEDPDTFAIYYKGQPVDIQVTGAGDNSFDPGDLVIFYAAPYDGGRFQNYNVYQFVYGDNLAGPRMATRQVAASTVPTATSIITQTVHVEFDIDYRSLYQRPDYADHFFDTQLYANTTTPEVTRSYDLALDDAVNTAGVVQIQALIHGGANQGANPDQSVHLWLNSHDAGIYQWDGSIDHLITTNAPASALDSAPNRVHLVAALAQLPGLGGANPYYWISPDWVRVSYPALAEAEGDRIYVEGMPPAAQPVAIAGFTSALVSAYDINDPEHPLLLSGAGVQPDGGAYTLYWDEAMAAPVYALTTEAALLAPGAIERDQPSNWAGVD